MSQPITIPAGTQVLHNGVPVVLMHTTLAEPPNQFVPHIFQDARVRPISECTRDDLVNFHAFVFGRCKIWTHDLTDTSDVVARWSKLAWWKAMWYSHRGGPQHSTSWGVYAGGGGFTGPGDAELTHFMRVAPYPRNCETQVTHGATPESSGGTPK